MASAVATVVFDGNLRRIYIVPPLSSYIVDGSGYRIYTPDDIPSAPEVLLIDVQRDLWSRGVDHWGDSNDWTLFPIIRSGGASRGFDENSNEIFQSVDFRLDAASGWLIVIPDYTHETRFTGNMFSNDPNGALFDYDRLTAQGVVPRVSGAADLLVYQSNVGSGLTPTQDAKLTAIPDNPLLTDDSRITTLLSDLSFVKAIEGGKWEIVGSQMIFYSDDNVTEVARFDIDDVNAPTVRTRV